MTSAHSDQPSAVCHCYPVTSFSIDAASVKGQLHIEPNSGLRPDKKPKKYHSFQEWGKLRMPPKSS